MSLMTQHVRLVICLDILFAGKCIWGQLYSRPLFMMPWGNIDWIWGNSHWILFGSLSALDYFCCLLMAFDAHLCAHLHLLLLLHWINPNNNNNKEYEFNSIPSLFLDAQSRLFPSFQLNLHKLDYIYFIPSISLGYII